MSGFVNRVEHLTKRRVMISKWRWNEMSINLSKDIIVRCYNCGFPAFADPSCFKHDKQIYIIRRCKECSKKGRIYKQDR